MNVLGTERVTHLAPTSGSSGARKLIPFTAGLQAGFSAAVGAWMSDLVRMHPGLLGGPSYLSVSPLTEDEDAGGKVPVGFADDAEYLGGVQAWLVRRALAVPAELRHERDMEVFWRRTLIYLLARKDLRMISVWLRRLWNCCWWRRRGSGATCAREFGIRGGWRICADWGRGRGRSGGRGCAW